MLTCCSRSSLQVVASLEFIIGSLSLLTDSKRLHVTSALLAVQGGGAGGGVLDVGMKLRRGDETERWGFLCGS